MLEQSTIDTHGFTPNQVEVINNLLKIEFIKGQQDEARYWRSRTDISPTF